MELAGTTVMVAALRKAIRLRAVRRSRDLRIGGFARTPPVGAADRAPPSAHGLAAQELIRMAQAARRARTMKGPED